MWGTYQQWTRNVILAHLIEGNTKFHSENEQLSSITRTSGTYKQWPYIKKVVGISDSHVPFDFTTALTEWNGLFLD